jgi:hypothetical protein
MLKVSICLLALMTGICAAQNNEEKGFKHDRLNFVVKELDGNKVVNSRAYATVIDIAPFYRDSGNGSSIRADSEVRLFMAPNSYQNVNVGVSIDAVNAREVPTGLALRVSADISDIAPGLGSTGATTPMTRRTKWVSDVVVPLREPTTIFSSDDPTSKHKMQLELTATPIS